MPDVPPVPETAEAPADERHTYAWAAVRVVPRVERGECLNAGVVLFCRPRRFLGVRLTLDSARLLALDPDLDLAAVERHLAYLERVAAGDAAAGAIARLPQAERFGWLVAPVSTVVQPGPVHAGICADPERELDDLFRRMVPRSRPAAG